MFPATILNLEDALAQSMLGDINTFGGATVIIGVPVTGALVRFDTKTCLFVSSDNSFLCQVGLANGLNYTLKYYLLDVNGIALSAFDPARVAALRTVLSVVGTFSNGSSTTPTLTTIDHQSDMILAGLQSPTRVLNGATRDHDVITTSGINNTQTTLDLTGATTNVIIPITSRYPVSGTISSVGTATRSINGLPRVTGAANAVLTFNGTSTALLVATAFGTSSACEIDLTGTLLPRCT